MPTLPVMQPRTRLVSALQAHMAWARPASHRPHHSCPEALYITSSTPANHSRQRMSSTHRSPGCPQPVVKAQLPRLHFSGLPGARAPSTAAPQGQAGGAGQRRSQSESEGPPPQPIRARSVPPATPFPSAASSAPRSLPPSPPRSGLRGGKTPPPTPAGGPRD